MTPKDTTRLIDALESIAFDLSGIRQELDGNKQTSAISHLLNTLNGYRINIDGDELTGSLCSHGDEISSSLDRVAEQLQNLA